MPVVLAADYADLRRLGVGRAIPREIGNPTKKKKNRRKEKEKYGQSMAWFLREFRTTVNDEISWSLDKSYAV